MRTAVRFRRAALDEMAAHALEEAPKECCGLLIGSADFVQQAERARNLKASAREYLVDPVDHFAAIRKARRQGAAVVGAYHSHPASAPVPSEKDQRNVTCPEFLYVIVAPGHEPAAAEIRAYEFSEGNFHEVRIVPVV